MLTYMYCINHFRVYYLALTVRTGRLFLHWGNFPVGFDSLANAPLFAPWHSVFQINWEKLFLCHLNMWKLNSTSLKIMTFLGIFFYFFHVIAVNVKLAKFFSFHLYHSYGGSSLQYTNVMRMI